ncbi:hypothetical protein DFH29DRAFT_900044 [Suillus ampliporus]|nr:hypothetical protein DFH29DRAFT_900044 [Suillus ampliporus]
MWFVTRLTAHVSDLQVTGGHTAKLSHELIASAAAYEAAKAYEKHVQANGKPPTMQRPSKAALTGGFIDRIAETKGMDEVDKQKAKHAANERAKSTLESKGDF